MLLKSSWVPRIEDGDGPVYQRIAAAIIEDLSHGHILPGTRLPAQRDLAFDLGVGLGTVTKAYSLLAKRGIAASEKGRAMFIRSKPAESTVIEMGVNIPPNLLSGKMLSKTLAELAVSVDKQDIGAGGSYPYQGSFGHRQCLAAWLQSYCASIRPEHMIFCNGGQHAIWISLAVLKKEDITIVTDEVPFAGLLWIAKDLNIKVVGVSSDGEGMRSDEFERVSKEVKRTGRQPVLYTSPTAQNPTGISLSNARMIELAKVCRTESVLILEDDVYTAFSSRDHSTFFDMAPGITFYLNSLAKILSPWFRLGVLVCPPRFHKAIMSYVSTNGSKISPIIAEVMQQWVASGLASEVAMMTHEEGIRRNNLAKQAFAGNQNALIGNGFHMFLPMPQDDSKLLWKVARRQGIRLSRPAISLSQDPNRSGIRICLGVPTTFDLKFGLAKVAEAHLKITAAKNPAVSRLQWAQLETR